ncbi:MAG: hypothetical protein FD137_1169 [Spirochaetes bacterium]|nr:MAG: hypothetical protein FD137_1169 [Spirochaetota bacterium]
MKDIYFVHQSEYETPPTYVASAPATGGSRPHRFHLLRNAGRSLPSERFIHAVFRRRPR